MPDTRSPLHILIVLPGARPAATVERAVLGLVRDGQVPDELHVIASPSRIDEVRQDVLSNGSFTEFCAANGILRDELLFNARTLHPVAPQRTDDCTAAADRLLGLLRSLTVAPHTALTVMLAEDAGLPGHLLQACLQLVARVDDRLMIDPAVRPRTNHPLRRPLELPLLLPPPNEPVPTSYADAIAKRRTDHRRLAHPEVLHLDPARRTVRIGETSFVLPAMQFFWLCYLAGSAGERFPLTELTAALSSGRRAPVQVSQRLTDGRARVFPQDLQRAFLHMFPAAADKFDAMFVRACGPHPGLPSTISKINAALRRALGPGAKPYLIRGGRGAGGYRIERPASAIQIAGRT